MPVYQFVYKKNFILKSKYLFGWYKFKYAQGETEKCIWQGIDSANEVIFIPFLLHDCICFYYSLCSSVYGTLVYLSHRYVLIKSHTEAAFMCFLEIHLPEEMTFCVENVMLTF